MLRSIAILVSALFFVSVSGCGSILKGKHQTIEVTSIPPGATVSIESGLSITTPGELILPRYSNYVLTGSSEEYSKQQVRLFNEEDIGMAILTGALTGGIGALVDGDALYNLKPTKVHFDFIEPSNTTKEDYKLAKKHAKLDFDKKKQLKGKCEKTYNSKLKIVSKLEMELEKIKLAIDENNTDKSQEKYAKVHEKLKLAKVELSTALTELEIANSQYQEAKNNLENATQNLEDSKKQR